MLANHVQDVVYLFQVFLCFKLKMATALEATLKLNGNQDQTLKAYIGEMIMPNFSMLLPNVVFLRLKLGKI